MKLTITTLLTTLLLTGCMSYTSKISSTNKASELSSNGNYAEAAKLYKKAAQEGYAPAQTRLGLLYRKGQGVPRDYQQAMNWYKKAAKQGDAVAMNNIGTLYADGYGVKQDYSIAESWYRKALKNGHSRAQANIDSINKKRKSKQSSVASVKTQPAVSTSGKQFYDIGTKYWSQNNYSEALIWFKKASDAGSQSGHIDAGRIYHDGRGNVAVNYPQAVKYYLRAAANNNHDAENRLGKMYYYGRGVKQDYSKALSYFNKASAARKEFLAGTSFGSYPLEAAEALNSIAYMYFFGQGVRRNLGLADNLFRRSNEKSSTELAIKNIAVMDTLKQNSCFSNQSFDLNACNKIASNLKFTW